LYGRWSSRKTLVLFAVLTAGVLIGFSRFHAGDSKMVFTVLTVLLLIGLSGMIAMLSPYSAELYPTSLRATGGGVAASSSKAGGIIGPSLVAFMLGISPGFMMPALFVAVPVLAAAVVLWFNGRETTGRRLEEIHQTPIRE